MASSSTLRPRSCLFAASLAAACALALAACSDDANGGAPPALDAGGDAAAVLPDAAAPADALAPPDRDAAPADAAPDGPAGACHALAQVGDTVRWFSKTAPAPAPAGGTIADGTYVLTEFSLHTPAFEDGTELSVIGKLTIALAGGKVWHVLLDRADGKVFRRTEEITTTGVDLRTTITCQDPVVEGTVPGSGQYTATPTTFTVFFPTPNGLVVNVYTKR